MSVSDGPQYQSFATSIKVDELDYDLLIKHSWRKHTAGYASTTLNGKTRFLHRMILERIVGRKLTPDEFTDHANHNKLDNRRSNLRVADKAQNSMNRGKRSDNTVGHKGVYLHWPKQWQERGWEKRWKAQVYSDNKIVSLGYYKTPEEAAYVYDQAAIQLYGDFVRPNILI